jgi:hypothetical protein
MVLLSQCAACYNVTECYCEYAFQSDVNGHESFDSTDKTEKVYSALEDTVFPQAFFAPLHSECS